MKRIWRTFGLLTATLAVILISTPARASDQDIKKLAADLAAKIRAKGYERVVVADFVDLDGATNATGKYISQKLVGMLAEEGVTVIDRSQVPKLFAEMDQITKGFIDPATSRSLGKQTGIEVVIAGTIYPGSLTIKTDARAIDLQAAKVLASPSHNISRLGTVGKMALKDEEGEDETEGESPSGGALANTVPSKPSKPRAPRTMTIMGLKFELEGCNSVDEGLACSATVTNLGTDDGFNFRCTSRVWDAAGNEYFPSLIKLSNSSYQCNESHWHGLEKSLVARVPTQLEMLFRGAGEEVSEVAQFETVWWGGQAHDSQQARFREILVGQGASTGGQYAQGGSGQPSNIAPVAPGKGGFLRRMGKLLGNAAEATAREMLEKEKKKLVGDDENDGDGE